MEKSLLHLPDSSQLVTEKVNFPFVHGPSNTITIACTRQDPLGTVPDENRGLVRKAADAFLNLIRYGRFDNSLTSRQWD